MRQMLKTGGDGRSDIYLSLHPVRSTCSIKEGIICAQPEQQWKPMIAKGTSWFSVHLQINQYRGVPVLIGPMVIKHCSCLFCKNLHEQHAECYSMYFYSECSWLVKRLKGPLGTYPCWFCKEIEQEISYNCSECSFSSILWYGQLIFKAATNRTCL